MNKKLVIFDLDGTLIDSLKDIAFSTNRVLRELGFEEHPIEEYKRFIGDGAKELVRRALPDSSDEKKVLEALEMFKKEYGEKETIHTKPFDGVYQMLQQLQDSCEFALLSNKPHEFTLKYMEQFFKEFGFKAIHGQKENVPKKPDPTGAYNILNELGFNSKDVFYIGDTATDMKTAVSTGLISIGVLWGIQEKEQLLSHGAQYIAKNPSEIVDIIENFSY